MKTFKLNQEVITPDGKAIITVIDEFTSSVRVKHLESKGPITDYKFEDITIIEIPASEITVAEFIAKVKSLLLPTIGIKYDMSALHKSVFMYLDDYLKNFDLQYNTWNIVPKRGTPLYDKLFIVNLFSITFPEMTFDKRKKHGRSGKVTKIECTCKFNVFPEIKLRTLFLIAQKHQLEDLLRNRKQALVEQDKLLTQAEENLSEAQAEMDAFLIEFKKVTGYNQLQSNK